MNLSRPARIALRAAAGLGFAVIYVPLMLVLVNSFNIDRSSSWPPAGLTLNWWEQAWHSNGARAALWTSVKAALGATGVSLVLGTLLAFAVQRFRFFGRESISFLVVLPIALPGIVTGVALNTAFRAVLEPFGVGLGMFTVVVGHATFCVVVVFNNVIARLRRTTPSFEEAAADLGADTFQIFRDITFPLVRSALVAGALLSFALSFDEIVVTTFTAGPGVQTLPIWVFSNMTRPAQAPVVNVVAAVLVLLSVIPIYLAQRLSSDTAGASRI